jgi:hypothetical protein
MAELPCVASSFSSGVVVSCFVPAMNSSCLTMLDSAIAGSALTSFRGPRSRMWSSGEIPRAGNGWASSLKIDEAQPASLRLKPRSWIARKLNAASGYRPLRIASRGLDVAPATMLATARVHLAAPGLLHLQKSAVERRPPSVQRMKK